MVMIAATLCYALVVRGIGMALGYIDEDENENVKNAVSGFLALLATWVGLSLRDRDGPKDSD